MGSMRSLANRVELNRMVHADHGKKIRRKLKGGGIAVLFNHCWSHPGHVTVKEKLCIRDIKLLMSFYPYYLP